MVSEFGELCRRKEDGKLWNKSQKMEQHIRKINLIPHFRILHPHHHSSPISLWTSEITVNCFCWFCHLSEILKHPRYWKCRETYRSWTGKGRKVMVVRKYDTLYVCKHNFCIPLPNVFTVQNILYLLAKGTQYFTPKNSCLKVVVHKICKYYFQW